MIKKDLSIDFLGVHFENPFCLSSSPVGNCYEMCKDAYDAGWAGIVYKTLSPDHFVVDEVSPRFAQLSKEDTPFIAFKNMEQVAEHPLAQDLADIQRLKKEYPDKVMIASIMGETPQDWTDLARLVTEAGADMIELNFSCPQMTSHTMGSDVGTNPKLCKKNCEAVKKGTDLPVLAKMTPNITTMIPVVKACLEGGADGVSSINTVKSITDIDLDTKVALPNINGKSAVSGLSGKAVKPIALRFLQQIRSAAGLEQLPVSGIGGIETWEDAAEFILLGASTLQVTTAIMQYGYRIIDDLTNGLMHYMDEQGVDHLEDLVGLANQKIVPTNKLDRDYVVYPKIDWDKCIGCGRCFISCQDGAHQAMGWDDEKRLPTFDQSKCVGCQLCALVCPVGAIKLGIKKMKPGREGDPADVHSASYQLPAYDESSAKK